MSNADTKAGPKMKMAKLTVEMVYDEQSDESERAAKLIKTMMDAFVGAVTSLDLDGCAASSLLASTLLHNMRCNGHENCACRVALDYVASIGHAVEITEPGAVAELDAVDAAADAARRKGMN